MSDWISAVAEADLPPGEHTVVEVDGAVMVLFNLDGEFFAIEDICTRDGSEISSGCVIAGSIECPTRGPVRYSYRRSDGSSSI